VDPVPLARTLPANLVGQSLRLVGYGRSAAATDDSGTRRAVTVAVTALTADLISFGVAGGAGICSGDSGGPALLRGADQVERVAGVHSLTRSSQCGVGDDIRVDARLAFIDGFVAANDPPTCAPDGRCAAGCATADPDCPAPCGADGVCTGAACTTPDPDCATCGADGVCLATSCPVPDPDCAACGADGVCSATACPTADPDCLEDGLVCTSASQCLGHLCLDDPRGFGFCSRPCTTTGDCQLDLVCRGGQCQAPAPLGGVRGGCATAPATMMLGAALLWMRRRNRLNRAA
jgi:hypothetical protein